MERSEASRGRVWVLPAVALAVLACTSARGATCIHEVRPGDTVSELAFFYEVSPEKLALLNALADPDRIHVGEALVIPLDSSGRCPTPEGPDLARLGALLDEARLRYDAADFEAALALADEARLELGRAAPEQRARAHWIQGLALTGLGRGEEAVEAFRRVLALDPSLAAQDQLSPKVRALVELAKTPS